MSSESYDPENDPICPDPPNNADMDGVAVAVANVMVHCCLRIMVTYSDGDIDLAIQSLLVQFYPILLSTLLSIKRQQLSTFDADFALLLSSSPLAIYLSFASICDLCGIRTGLFKRIKCYRNIVRALGAFVPFLWTVLSTIKSFSNKAFLRNPCDLTLTFPDWVGNIILAFFTIGRGITPGVGLVTLFPFLVLLYRRWSQVRADTKLSSDRASRLRAAFTLVKCSWCTIDRRHKWCIHFLFLFIDTVWSFQVMMTAASANGEKYVLSYGQLLSLFFILPTLGSTIEFLLSMRRSSLLPLLTEHGFEAEVRYFCTGKEPDPPVRDSHLPFNATSLPEKPTVSKLYGQMTVGFPLTRRPPYSPELDHTMRKWFGA